MIGRLRQLARRFWPVLRLRWLLFAALLFVAALPGVAALTLRVYENTLVRRTEAEVIAQGSAIAASAAVLWPSDAAATSPAAPPPPARWERERYPEAEIDLRTAPVLPDRPPAQKTDAAPDPAAVAVIERLEPAMIETTRETLAAIMLLDRQGIVLNGRDKGLSLAELPEVQSALSGHGTTVLRHNDAYALRYPLEWVSRATDIRLHRAQPVHVGGKTVGVVLVSRSSAALFRGMWEDRGKIAVGVAVIFALLVLLTAVLARAIVRPVEDLSRAARALARGQHAEPPHPTLRVAELTSLIDDFAIMAAAIEHRSRYLRDFAAALSHEFKTPLAGLTGGIELLQDHGPDMSEEERARFLANMAGDAKRLSRLVSRLMELAKADMSSPTAGASTALFPVLRCLADAMTAHDFTVQAAATTLPALAIDEATLESVLSTLLENARQAGATRVKITPHATTGTATIDIADNGPGIDPRDAPRIFDPFFTSKRESGGTGLGLPIARALVAASAGSLELVESEGGAVFRLTLPGAPAGD